ncbi:hypothetical protein DYD21_06830 [Rhodohalobacter sp. SW132]|uniref:hypothetical protein n=1 Tax=Rhodohalobacter sp. SW132 TaxID=2293433 RepID=UPI000E26C339|nr:hypothetical protein [Rhodohalobacter sp. SW132]REL38315.1 hypothetical protein DYD21_06830 [Rhodohalobacter sp. SW132]
MVTKILKLAVAVALLPLLLHSQNRQGVYLKVDYLTVDHTQLTEFKNSIIPQLEEHKNERISSGDIDSWVIYRVLYSGSGSNHYNYVSITSAPSIGSFDELNTNKSDLLLTFSERDMYQLMKSELWTVRNSLVNQMTETPSNFLMMDYMHVRMGRELEYQMLEDEVAKPLHERRMDREIMEAWEMYQLVAPGGLEYGYNFATGNYFTKLEHIEFGFNEELIRSQNPNVNLMEFFEHIWSTRDLVRSEIWQRIGYVTEDEPYN